MSLAEELRESVDPLTGERWRDVPNFPRYRVSDAGQLLDMKTCCIVQLDKNRRVHIHGVNSAEYSGNLGVLVLTAFVGPRPIGLQCRHLDDNWFNNALSNLRWGTRSENAHDAYANSLRAKRRRKYRVDLTAIELTEARSLRACRWSYVALGARYNMDRHVISALVRGLYVG